MSFLDDLIKPRPASRDIMAALDQFAAERAVISPMKDGDRVRPSGIEDFCPRMEAIRVERKISLRDEIPPKLARIFSQGRAFERHLRDTMMAPAGLLIGAWRCLRCGHISGKPRPDGAIRRPQACSSCSQSTIDPETGDVLMSYVEPFGYVDREASELGGSGDGFVLWDSRVSLLEVKTANDDRFRQVSRARFPFAENHSQAQVYMRAFGVDRTLFWYHNKNNGDHLCLWVALSDQVSKALVAKAESLKQYFRQNQFPARICDSRNCERAKACPTSGPCFDEAWPT